MTAQFHLMIVLVVLTSLLRPSFAGTIEVSAQRKPVFGAKVFVAEARPEGEETLVAQGTTENGRFAFEHHPDIRYNVYVIADGFRAYSVKDQQLRGPQRVSLKALPSGTRTTLAEKGVGFSLLPDMNEDLVPERANQGSPPDGWILKIGGSGALVDKDTKMTGGTFWVKNGEKFTVSRDEWRMSCKFVGSIARKFIIIECRYRKAR